MKILIADDDPVARRLLKVFLEKANYEVVVAEEGRAALAGLLAPGAPVIAILDWMMPGLSGLDVTTQLRAVPSKIRPYVVLLTAKSDKPDIAAGLDAGADEFLSKPFNTVELLARLRVAERTIRYQVELQKHIGDLELLVQRYNLLGELIGQQGGQPGEPGSENGTTHTAKPVVPQKVGPVELTAEDVNATVVRVLSELGLGEAKASVIPTEGLRTVATFCAWAGIILVKEQIWIDLLLELTPETAAKVFEKKLRRKPSSDREILNFLAETHTIFSAAIKSVLSSQGGELMAPLLSRAQRTDTLHKPPALTPESALHVISGPEFSINLSLVRRPSPVREKTMGQLKEMDILAESFPPADVNQMPLLNQGVVLNERFINKLGSLGRADLQKLPLSVIQPSSFAFYFYGDSLSTSDGL